MGLHPEKNRNSRVSQESEAEVEAGAQRIEIFFMVAGNRNKLTYTEIGTHRVKLMKKISGTN